MSIINEALKKTEKQLEKNSAKSGPLAAKPLAHKHLTAYILILLVGLALGNFIFFLLKHKTQIIFPAKQNPAPVILSTVDAPHPTAVLPVPATEENKPAPATNYILNGIFFSNDDGYALVNNQIVRENDSVDGATVGLITADSVQLDKDGEIITLTTRR